MEKTFYEILEISPNASQEVIKMAHRALIKKYHPDAYIGDKTFAENKVKEINEAYTALSDEKLKREYDFRQKENIKKSDSENRSNQEKARQEQENFSERRNDPKPNQTQANNPPSTRKSETTGDLKGCLGTMVSGFGRLLWKVVKFGIILFIIINLISGRLRSTAYNIWSGIQGIASNAVEAVNNKILDADVTEPEYAVQKYLEAIKNLDAEGAKPYVSSGTEFSEMTDSIFDTNKELDDPEEFGYEMMKEVRKFDYYLDKADYRNDDKEATVDVKINVVNLYELSASALTEYNQKMNDEDWIDQYAYEIALSGDEDAAAANIYEDIINEGLGSISKPTMDRTIKFNLVKEGDQWMIVSVSNNESFLEAMTGNYISVAEELNEIQ